VLERALYQPGVGVDGIAEKNDLFGDRPGPISSNANGRDALVPKVERDQRCSINRGKIYDQNDRDFNGIFL
jgi:hypothetical protein